MEPAGFTGRHSQRSARVNQGRPTGIIPRRTLALESPKIKSRTKSAVARAVVALVAAFGWAASSRADFQVEIYEDGNSSSAAIFRITGGNSATGFQGSISSTSTTNATMIMGNVSAFKDFSLTGLNFTSNSPVSPTPSSADLTLTGGTITLKTGSSPHTLTVVASDSGFSFPTGVPSLLKSTEGYSMTVAKTTTTSDAYKFQSFASPGADLFDTTHTQSPGHTFTIPTATAPANLSGSATEAPTQLTFIPSNPYTLTFKLNYTANTTGNLFLATGSATVSAGTVPEPASAVMLALGSLGLAGIAIRRRTR